MVGRSSLRKRKQNTTVEIDSDSDFDSTPTHSKQVHSPQKKKQRTTMAQSNANILKDQDKLKKQDIANNSSDEEKPGFTEDEEEDDDMDGIDWETIELPPRFEDMTEPTPQKYNDVEIVMETPRPVMKKSYWEQAYQRNVREWTHNAHIVLLVAHYKLRNKWCSFSNIKEACLSIIPQDTKRVLEKDSKEKTLVTGIKWLMNWWDNYFTITKAGLTSKPSTEYEDVLHKDFSELLKEAKEVDQIADFQDFLKILLETKQGTRDTCAQLFVALLRACGCQARLICSLQPISYKLPSRRKQQEKEEVAESSSSFTTNEDTTDNIEEEEEEKDKKGKKKAKKNKLLFPFRPNMRPAVDLNKQLKSKTAKPPIIWAEVYSSDTKRWICIDPIRKYIDKPLLMEPAHLNKENHLSFVLAMDDHDACTDVTRRYTLNMERALRLRERPLTRREKQAGLTLWSDLFLGILCHVRPLKKNQQRIEDKLREDSELEEQKNKNERMPTSFDGFRNHPIYALERHVKRLEVIHPSTTSLGSFKGEKIFPRSSVKTVSTADTWKKLGRVIKTGEQPVKHISSRAVTIEKKRLKEQAKQQGKELTVPCYGEWQTVAYKAEPVVDGKIPKNSFGNIDLFTAEMLPEGAVHIPIKGIGKIARQLDIDYADAVIDFEFVKMRSVPMIDGIVVAEEYKDTLLKVWNEIEHERINKSIIKQEKQVYLRWRKLIKGLLIKARIDNEYKQPNGMTDWSEDGISGGFLPE